MGCAIFEGFIGSQNSHRSLRRYGQYLTFDLGRSIIRAVKCNSKMFFNLIHQLWFLSHTEQCSDKNLHQIIIRIHLPDFSPIQGSTDQNRAVPDQDQQNFEYLGLIYSACGPGVRWIPAPIYPNLVNLFGLFFSGFGWSNIEYLRIKNCEIVIDIMRISSRDERFVWIGLKRGRRSDKRRPLRSCPSCRPRILLTLQNDSLWLKLSLYNLWVRGPNIVTA